MYAAVQAGTADDLVIQHAPLVKRIAYHLMGRLPDAVQLDDLIQSGMLGLLEAIKNYDAGQGASFETYAGIRIRGRPRRIASRKVRAPQGRVVGNAHRPKGQGKCHREQTANGRDLDPGTGKGETAR
jgi:RNA polymerase sigma factor (sigma-70 family)